MEKVDEQKQGADHAIPVPVTSNRNLILDFSTLRLFDLWTFLPLLLNHRESCDIIHDLCWKETDEHSQRSKWARKY